MTYITSSSYFCHNFLRKGTAYKTSSHTSSRRRSSSTFPIYLLNVNDDESYYPGLDNKWLIDATNVTFQSSPRPNQHITESSRFANKFLYFEAFYT